MLVHPPPGEAIPTAVAPGEPKPRTDAPVGERPRTPGQEGRPMPNTPTTYRIRVKGHLGPRWSAWFDGLTITNLAHGEAELGGPLADQTALHGVLLKVRDL